MACSAPFRREKAVLHERQLARFGACCWGISAPQINRLAVLAPVSVPLAAALNLTAMNLGVAVAALGGGWVLQQYGVESICWAAALVAVAALGVAWVVPDGRRA
jgi:predicted MFS family arabinose efflux permease